MINAKICTKSSSFFSWRLPNFVVIYAEFFNSIGVLFIAMVSVMAPRNEPIQNGVKYDYKILGNLKQNWWGVVKKTCWFCANFGILLRQNSFVWMQFCLGWDHIQNSCHDTKLNGRMLSCRVSFMLSVTSKPFMLSVIMPSTVVPLSLLIKIRKGQKYLSQTNALSYHTEC